MALARWKQGYEGRGGCVGDHAVKVSEGEQQARWIGAEDGEGASISLLTWQPRLSCASLLVHLASSTHTQLQPRLLIHSIPRRWYEGFSCYSLQPRIRQPT